MPLGVEARASPRDMSSSGHTSDDGVGRSLSADEFDSGAVLQRNGGLVINDGDNRRGGGGLAVDGITGGGATTGGDGIRNQSLFTDGTSASSNKGRGRTRVKKPGGGVVSASTSALPPRRTLAATAVNSRRDGMDWRDIGDTYGRDVDGGPMMAEARHTTREGFGGFIGMEDKQVSMWKRWRTRFKAKAQNARGSLRLDRAAFAKWVGRKTGPNNTGNNNGPGGGGGAGRDTGGGGFGGRKGNPVSPSSASLRRQRFRNAVIDGIGNKDAGNAKKKGKKKKSERGGLRGLPKRVFSSPPNFPGRGVGRRARFSNLGRGSTAVDEADLVKHARGRRHKTALGGKGISALVDIAGGGAHLRGATTGRDVAPNKNAENFRRVLEDTIAGILSFRDLLDCMFILEERLNPEIKEMLIKYLSKQENMEGLIEMLTIVVPNTPKDPVVKAEGAMTGPERVRYRYSYVSSMLLSNGPIQLRRVLFLNANYLDRLINVLGFGTPTDRVVVSSVCKVLLSVLRDSPEDSIRAMIRRKDFVPALLSHVSVTGTPEVCLSMLSTVRCQADLKFGAPNKPVVGIMAEAKVQETLCAKLAQAAESGPIDGLRSATIENCSRCIVGIALRALVIPRFDINDDDADADYMTRFNNELAKLDLFQNPEPLMGLVDSGLRSIDKYDKRGYGLATALTAIRYILVTAINAQDSSLSAIRMQLMNVSTTSYEESISRRIPRLAEVLAGSREDTTVVTMWDSVQSPLGVVRLKILELLIVLQQHGRPKVSQVMVESRIPSIIMALFKRLRLNSLCLHITATMVEQSFRCQNDAMRRAFLIDNDLIDELIHLWKLGNIKEGTRAKTPVADQGELLRMIISVRDFLKQTVPEVQNFKAELGAEKIAKFSRFCEGEIAERVGLHSKLLGGIDKLPPRNDDGPSFEDMPAFGGSEGALYFRGRSGAGDSSLI